MDPSLAFLSGLTFPLRPMRSAMRALAAAGAFLAVPHAASASPIRILTGNYPPFEYVENGKVQGLAVELLTEAFRRCHQEMKIEVLPWARALAETQQGQADAIFTAIKTPEREATLRFSSEALLSLNSALYSKKGAAIRYNGNLSDLAGYRLGLVNGTSHGVQFDSALDTGLLKYVDRADDTKPNILKLLAGRIDLIVADRFVVTYYMRANNWQDQLTELSPILHSSAGYLAFNRNPALEPVRNQIDAALVAMKKDGSYQRILSRYDH